MRPTGQERDPAGLRGPWPHARPERCFSARRAVDIAFRPVVEDAASDDPATAQMGSLIGTVEFTARQTERSGGFHCRGSAVEIPVGTVVLRGDLQVPERAAGVVVFAHGSGSGRHSPRNRFVADVLTDAGLGTLLLDLLTPDEEVVRGNVFDIELLAARLTAATGWLGSRPETASCRVGYFGASTGAGAALSAAADAGPRIWAVVSRGGRPDLTGRRLTRVRSPTLLIVGSRDQTVLELNRQAQARLRCPNRLTIIEGATHLFEEPGTLADAATHARDWFLDHLPTTGAAPPG